MPLDFHMILKATRLGSVGSAIRRLLPDQRGNAALIAAAAFPLLIGSAGLAVDGIQWVVQKRQIQAAADGAAIAGVYGLIGSVNVDSAVSDSFARTGQIPSNASIQVVQSPPGHEKDPYAVTVQVTVPARMTFTSMFMKSAPIITADATASVVPNGHYCAFALGDTDDSGVVVRPNSSVEMNCGIATNSTSAKAAVQADGSSTLSSNSIFAAGGVQDTGAIKNSKVRPYALAQSDPLEGTDPPLIPNTGCPNATVNPDSGGETALQPGCYANMTLNGNVRLQDGEYILNQGNFVVGPQGHVSCDACTIFLTSEYAATNPATIGKVKISSDATVKMNASREGPNAGILFYQDRHANADLPGDENRIGGGSFTKLNGLVYFPGETVYVDANMNPDVQCTRFIAKRLIFAGRVYISSKCDGLDKMTFEATEVRLIS